MQIVKEVVMPFLLSEECYTGCAAVGDRQMKDEDVVDAMLTLLNDVILELFEKIRDIYCVLESLVIITEQIIEKGLKIGVLVE